MMTCFRCKETSDTVAHCTIGGQNQCPLCPDCFQDWMYRSSSDSNQRSIEANASREYLSFRITAYLNRLDNNMIQPIDFIQVLTKESEARNYLASKAAEWFKSGELL